MYKPTLYYIHNDHFHTGQCYKNNPEKKEMEIVAKTKFRAHVKDCERGVTVKPHPDGENKHHLQTLNEKKKERKKGTSGLLTKSFEKKKTGLAVETLNYACYQQKQKKTQNKGTTKTRKKRVEKKGDTPF